MRFPKKTQLAENANWAVPVLAAFIARPQAEQIGAAGYNASIRRQYRGGR